MVALTITSPPWELPRATHPAFLDANGAIAKALKGLVALDPTMLGYVGSFTPFAAPIPLDVFRYVFGPLIIHCSEPKAGDGSLGWVSADMLKQWHPRVAIERLEILTGEREDLVSPTELWLVMHNAIMTAPVGNLVL